MYQNYTYFELYVKVIKTNYDIQFNASYLFFFENLQTPKDKATKY